MRVGGDWKEKERDWLVMLSLKRKGDIGNGRDLIKIVFVTFCLSAECRLQTVSGYI